jgi:hypothetical protein
MAGLQSLDKCPNDHDIRQMKIRCPEPDCGRFILFSSEIYRERRATTFTQASVLILSTVAALLAFRFTSQVWPLYLFLMLGVVLLYATIFTRGGALAGAAWILACTVAGWLVWQTSDYLFGRTLTLGPTTNPAFLIGPLLAWLLFTAYMYYMGSKRTLKAVKTAGTYFLTAGTFTFGFWGIWLLLVESDLTTSTLLRIAVGLGLLLPLVGVGFLVWANPKSPTASADGRLNMLALWLVVVATYLILIEPLIRALSFVLGQFFPLALGRRPLPDVTVDWLGGPGWRAVLTSALLLVAATLVAVHSAIEVIAEEGGPTVVTKPATTASMPAAATSADPDQEGADSDSDEESVDVSAEFVLAAEAIGETASQTLWNTAFIGRLIGRIGLRFLKNVLRTASRVFNVVLPVVVFSVLSMLVVLVLSEFRAYQLHGPFFSAISIWGAALTVLVLVVILCGAAYELAPSVPRDSRVVDPATGRPRWRSRSLVETGAASLLAGLLYFLVSLVSVALLPLWFYLRDSSVGLEALAPGPIFFVNLSLSMGALGLLIVPNLRMVRFRRRSSRVTATNAKAPPRPNRPTAPQPGAVTKRTLEKRADKPTARRSRFVYAGAVLVSLTAAALAFGFPPIRVGATYAMTPADASAAQRIDGLLPAAVRTGCVRDGLMLTGYLAGRSCHDDPTNADVSYHLFTSDERLSEWYGQAVVNRDLPLASGRCGSAAAEGQYAHGSSHGRVACYADRSGSWLIWTEEGVHLLGIAHRVDGRPADLFAAWEAGALSRSSS